MSDQDYLETLVAKYRSTRSQGWTEAAAAHAEALCAAVERLVAEPSHANPQAWYWAMRYRQAAEACLEEEVRAGKAERELAEVRVGRNDFRQLAIERSTELSRALRHERDERRSQASALQQLQESAQRAVRELAEAREQVRICHINHVDEVQTLRARIQVLESAVRWAITEIRSTRFSHYIADRLEASVLPSTDPAVRTQALEQMLRRLTDRELSVDGLYRMMGEARALVGAGPGLPDDSFTVGQRVRIKGATELYRTSGTIKRIAGTDYEVVHPDGWSTYHGVDELEPLTAQGGS